MAIDTKKLVTVFGGSGFLGRYVVHALAKRGHRIRVACRRPDLAYHLQIAGNLGQIQAVQANLRFPWSVERALEGADHAVNLVGILAEAGDQSFTALQAEGAGLIAQGAAKRGIGMVQMSAIGADADSPSEYARTKADGERRVLEAVPGAVILRPSIVFGAEDQFFNRFANMTRLSPVLPLLGGGHTRFQPVFVNDVALAVADAVEGKVEGGRVYELGGPEALSFRAMMEEMLRVVERRRRFVNIPFGLAAKIADWTSFLPGAPLTTDQVTQLQIDNVVSDRAISEKRTFEAFGIRPRTLEAVLPTYLVRFRPQGQFTKPQPHDDRPAEDETLPGDDQPAKA
ncbi:complex I NDUFA9 subunit family protein [Aureimonas jatrophae]|uniref:NADH dehydrogenase n=1 Tax=Aureimonas jatrophae TaxID=1166073 RepID=A0A1H0IT82_9HYPH|nr:complex I NDUFA9 subunit family protein [Aureimonas jatrophae]MBB3952351.1 NADH dehydrogenase [Aureimonas jatrophae]SDO34676.1 NADH dehydrogenase [Aureimonas jatrophae]